MLVCGPTGCGKTTLLSCLNGLIPTESGGSMVGTVKVLGMDTNLGPSALFPHVATVFQNPAAQIITGSVADEVAFGLENLGCPAQTMESRITEVLELVGLSDRLNNPVDTLSGGQKQRLAIAAALAVRPRLLLLDEPISQLDSEGTGKIMQILCEIVERWKVTVILVEHRWTQVIAKVSRVIEMDNGQIVFDGNPSDFKYTNHHILDSVTPEAKYQNGIKTCQKGDLLKEPLITLENVGFRYKKDGPWVLRKIDLCLFKGQRVAILGPNGAGKSTLLSLVAGLKRPEEGKIHFFLGPARHRLSVSMLMQDPDLMLFAFSVRKELSFAPVNLGLLHHEIHKRVDQWLEKMNIKDLSDEPPFALSRGQRLRVALSSILTGYPKVLLLDEPTTGQDKRQVEALMKVLSDEAELVMFATHDLDFAKRFATRVLIMSRHEIREL